MIAVGCDHAGYELKREVISHLTEKGYEIMDLGCNGESCDYPLIANEVADILHNKKGLISLRKEDGSFNTRRFLFSK